ncbi:unnamed protein product [Amoebophrya sp. A120]|nr:unnamed protein product [Amoebophrya sp. A120]|eukprot:GSA120T00014110001.1
MLNPVSVFLYLHRMVCHTNLDNLEFVSPRKALLIETKDYQQTRDFGRKLLQNEHVLGDERSSFACDHSNTNFFRCLHVQSRFLALRNEYETLLAEQKAAAVLVAKLHEERKRLLQQFVDLRLALVELQPAGADHGGATEENKNRKEQERQTQSTSGGGKNQTPGPDQHNNAVYETEAEQQDVENYENDAARRKRLADFLSPQVLTGFSLFTFAYVGLHLVFPRLGRRFGTVLAALHLSHGLVVREQVFGKPILKTLCGPKLERCNFHYRMQDRIVEMLLLLGDRAGGRNSKDNAPPSPAAMELREEILKSVVSKIVRVCKQLQEKVPRLTFDSLVQQFPEPRKMTITSRIESTSSEQAPAPVLMLDEEEQGGASSSNFSYSSTSTGARRTSSAIPDTDKDYNFDDKSWNCYAYLTSLLDFLSFSAEAAQYVLFDAIVCSCEWLTQSLVFRVFFHDLYIAVWLFDPVGLPWLAEEVVVFFISTGAEVLVPSAVVNSCRQHERRSNTRTMILANVKYDNVLMCFIPNCVQTCSTSTSMQVHQPFAELSIPRGFLRHQRYLRTLRGGVVGF